jgi:6-phosphofructokinase 1
MVTIERQSSDPYEAVYGEHPLNEIANIERTIPPTMINKDGNGVTDEFIQYALPLIKGLNEPKYKNGLQQFAKMVQNNDVE